MHVEEEKKSPLREFADMALYIISVLLLAFLIYHFVGQQVEVDGHSMLETLDDGEHLILEKLSYRFGSPDRFDIIVFRPYKEERSTYYIKRLIGLPGETIQIIEDEIYINGELLNENYGKEAMYSAGIAETPITLGKDEYFVLGDNRNNSIDSRDERVGVVKKESIVGKVCFRIWPLNKFGILSKEGN